jgi:hypothetical protein
MKNILSATILLLVTGFLYGQSSVFPGDANANGIVDQYDVLSIGYAFGNTGPARIQQEDFSTQGIAQPWPDAFPGGLNFIHADADGNGAVTMFDFVSWNLHYGAINGIVTPLSFPEPSPATSSMVSWNNEQLIAPFTGGQTISIPIDFIFPETQTVNGVAFRLRYETDHFAAAELDMSNNWLVSDGNGLSLQKNLTGSFEVGVTRFGNAPIPGGGTGGTFNLIVIDDMIALLETGPDTITSWLVVEDVLAVDDAFEALPVVVDSFEIKLYRPGNISATFNAVDDLEAKLFPNPTTGVFQLETALPYKNLFIFNTLGHLVYEENNETGRRRKSFDLQLKPGCYFLRVASEAGASCTKLIIE